MSVLDKVLVARTFGHAAYHYDVFAELQQTIGNRLLTTLHNIPHFKQATNLQILDAGCGTGFLADQLKNQGHTLTALDLSEEMLGVARVKACADHYICADMETLPFENGCFDFCVSNLALQWCPDIAQALKELTRVVKRGGMTLFTTVLAGSLWELEVAWQAIDHNKHVINFRELAAIQAACQDDQHCLTTMEEILYFPDLLAVLRSLQNIGATTVAMRPHKGLRGRETLRRLAEAYPTTDAGYPLTYRIVLGVIEQI